MGYTFTEHTANGTQVTYPFRFAGRDKGYLRASDVRVDTLQGDTWTKVTSGWQLTGTNQITFDVAPAEGLKIRIRREVPKENPYAEFDRGVTLDMKSLNGSFIHNLEATQELLDGFYPEGYYVKQNVSWGGNKITDLASGTIPNDAVNKGQLDSVDKKHTEWNKTQDEQLYGILHSFISNVSHRSAPWSYSAAGGEDKVKPPFFFKSALVWRDGVYQDEQAGAFEIRDNTIFLAKPLLRKGERVSVILGSRIAAPDKDNVLQLEFPVVAGSTEINLGMKVSAVSVFLNGLLQSLGTYELVGDNKLVFGAPLPDCTVIVQVKLYTE